MKAISITPGIPEVRVTEFPEPELESPRVFPLCREEGWDKLCGTAVIKTGHQ